MPEGFGHSQTSCCGQLTCSRCESAVHASTDCILELKCINCSQPHPSSDSKICPKWKIEKQIEEIKTNKNISYPETETEIRSLTTPDKFSALSTETLPESVPTTSNSEHSNAAEIPLFVKRNSRNRRKRSKVQKPEIEIKMAPHRPRKAAPTELTTDDEDMITYDVEEVELEQDPPNEFIIKEDPLNFPKGYLRSLTPSRYRKSRG
ncbi:hypothetical protein TNCV_2408261 [Trichonephila clavipes]|nr:hypothetical protein TNCV_2408261 [Trichonephila clavipes]